MYKTVDNTTMYELGLLFKGEWNILLPWYYNVFPKWLRKKLESSMYVDFMTHYYDELGFPPNYITYLSKMQQYAKYTLQVYEGKKHMKINAKKSLLDAQKHKSTPGEGVGKIFNRLSKWYGFKRNEKEMTIREFYDSIDEIKNESNDGK